MRARLARPRRIARGRLVAPVAAAAAVALVGGVVVAAPDAPTVGGDVQTVAGSSSSASPLTVTGFTVGNAEFSFDIQSLASGVYAGIEITEVEGLPEDLTYADGTISGTPAVGGTHHITVIGKVNGAPVSIPATLVVNNADGTAPTGASGGSTAAVEGSLGGQAEAGGQVTTGSDGTDAILGAVAGVVSALGGDAGSVTELATGSTGQGGTTPVNPNGPENPTGPLGSLAGGELGLGSTGATPQNPGQPGAPGQPENPAPETGSLGLPGSSATGEVTGGANGGLDTQSLGPLAPLGSLIDAGTETGSTTDGGTQPAGSTTTGGTTTGGELTTAAELTGGGEITVPGSSFPADTGSLGALAPGLALTGAAMLGLAGLTLALNGGSSAPGSTAILPALPGSTTTGATTNGGSSGSTAPTVAAGAPRTVQAPGPTVANGRG
ncbi:MULTISPECIES: hypothetical protein [Dietzia]|uniref:hypothetical protein n=1 Tax=Dietzia TaxID=37914 RepID=UPI00078394E2|nr:MULTISPECIES: hypothetical protein [Dietzia]KZO58286.1 hypothetical protein A2U19_13305 [Dietzia maris]MCT2121163.1 hypothetical protein [Dietzia cinnamea]MCT2145575.1 hypothetical protein [Dietzia cinnamea]MCT2304926.1 hypothetical protein [Dietzia cinnamea]